MWPEPTTPEEPKMAKCKNCRKKRPNMENCPKKTSGSIRAAKRAEQRALKKRRLAEATNESVVELSSGNTISESIVSVI